MQQLSGLDATFLHIETAQMPMHVGALQIIELPAGFKGRFVVALRKHIAQRLSAAPVLSRRLWWMPLNIANPAWVDAEPDLRQHIVQAKLPRGAGQAELEAQVGALHSELLDRDRPLWKMHVFEGLAAGANGARRVALYTQLHHAAVDGQGAVALANAILDLAPGGRAVAARAAPSDRVFKLEMTEMLRGVLGNQAQKVAQILRELPATVGTLKDAAAKALSQSWLLSGVQGSGNLTLAPRTPLNVSVGEGRAFAAVTLPLPELKDIGRAHEATINDLVLMVCSTALRRFYGSRRLLPRKSMVAAVPITLRAQGDTRADNQASMSLVSLGTNIADTRRRLQHVQAANRAMKSTMGGLKSVLPADYPSLGVPWLLEAAAALYGKARVADRIPQLANLVISNVPGPPVALYLAGARVLTNYPTSIVVHGLALNITVQSYDQSLDFGLMADAQALPEVRELADAIRIAFDDLRALPRPGEPDDDSPAQSLVGQARRRLTGAVGEAARKVVGSAVDHAVAQVTRWPRANPKGGAAAKSRGGR
ncbi:MAG: wax ester/triacylglycerol synthase family O-acyltransferase [Rubrivivax sp.]|nr:wax ester/triacylglycerol synthase family O-acyltransferase [Rubrivivax sp.]